VVLKYKTFKKIKLLKSISYVSISKLVIILSQLFFVATFAKILPVEDLGTYVLALSVITPIAWALTFDVPIKIISNSLETKNLFIILFPNIFFLSALILIFFLMSVFSVEVSIFYLLILLLLVLKIGEIVSEIYNADLRQEEKFIYFSLVSSIRFFTIYAVGAVTIISGYQIIFTILVLSILSLAFGLWSFYRLFKSGFYFKLNINDVMPYVNRNQSLGIASGMKFFSTNLMRYFVAFQFGINILGYLTPIFYGLTALSSISTVFENIISPKISKRLDNNKFSVTSNKYELSILLAMSIFIIIFTLLLSNYFYSFFFLDDKENYHYLLVVFSIGWFFYTSRGILKVISYKLKLQYLQIKIQFIFIFLLSVLMYIFSLFFGILGVSIAFVISNAMVCFYYIFQIKR
jgi:O-antigen/teichoic acid export membrane protein